MTSRRRGRGNARPEFSYVLLEERRMLSTNLPDIDGQIALTRDYLDTNPETKYLLSDRSDLRFVEMKYGLASTTTRYQQLIDGIPVHGAVVTINQGADSEFQQVHHELAFDTATVDFPQLETSLRFSVGAAETAAMEMAGLSETYVPTRGELAWYVDDSGEIHQVWDLMVFGAIDPVGDFLTIVDVNSLEVLLQENRAAFATGIGDVFEPNPYQTQGGGTGLQDNGDADSPELDAELISVTLERLNEGTGLLIGEFVDLATLNSPNLDDVDADEADRVYQYTRSDDRFEQVVIYHAVDQMNHYFHQLGFDDDSGIPNGIRDFPTLANAHWFNADNSFYSTADDAIHFGDGGVDDAEDADIVAHEYGHAIQFNQNASWGGGEMGAMGEGFGDWLAAVFYMNDGDPSFQAQHAAAVGEWDATSYSSDNPPNLRRVDGNKMYPDDLGFGVHADGEIWSRALWDLTGNVGRDDSMKLVLEHHFMLPAFASMTQAAETLLTANDNVFSGNREAAVRHPFVERGILPNEAMVSFDQSLYGTDETITIHVSDLGATNGDTVVLTTPDGDMETLTLTDTGNGLMVASISIGESGINQEDGILGVQSELTDVTVTYLSAGGPVSDTTQIEADIQIIEGTPDDDVIVVTINPTETIIEINGERFPIARSTASQVVLDAQAGYDRLTIFDSAGNDATTIKDGQVDLLGEFDFFGNNIEWVSLVSRGGTDSANLFGTPGDDSFTAFGNTTTLQGPGYTLATTDYQRVLVFGGEGQDNAELGDTEGNDRFAANEIFANMRSTDRFINVRDFETVTAHATKGHDVATFTGTDAAETFRATPDWAKLEIGSESLLAYGFDRTYTRGGDGDDRAVLFGSAGNEVLVSRPNNAYLFNDQFLNQVVGFEVVVANANGGNDRARLVDSPGADRFYATPEFATLANDQRRVRVNGFGTVTAIGSAGFDSATFVDSAGDDQFVARPESAYLHGEGYLVQAIQFNRVDARSNGGVDRALLLGSREDNRFFGSRDQSYLFGSTFFNSAAGFRYVTTRFNNDALYIGTFEDSAGDDTFLAQGNRASLFGDDYLVVVEDLDVANAKSDHGGTDRLFANLANFDVNVEGDWI